MRTRRIGSLDVSVVGLGCNNFGSRIDEQATRAEALAIGRWAHEFAEPLRREAEGHDD